MESKTQAIKACSRCGTTEKLVIRYPTNTMDFTINYCDECANEIGYTFR